MESGHYIINFVPASLDSKHHSNVKVPVVLRATILALEIVQNVVTPQYQPQDRHRASGMSGYIPTHVKRLMSLTRGTVCVPMISLQQHLSSMASNLTQTPQLRQCPSERHLLLLSRPKPAGRHSQCSRWQDREGCPQTLPTIESPRNHDAEPDNAQPALPVLR